MKTQFYLGPEFHSLLESEFIMTSPTESSKKMNKTTIIHLPKFIQGKSKTKVSKHATVNINKKIISYIFRSVCTSTNAVWKFLARLFLRLDFSQILKRDQSNGKNSWKLIMGPKMFFFSSDEYWHIYILGKIELVCTLKQSFRRLHGPILMKSNIRKIGLTLRK